MGRNSKFRFLEVLSPDPCNIGLRAKFRRPRPSGLGALEFRKCRHRTDETGITSHLGTDGSRDCRYDDTLYVNAGIIGVIAGTRSAAVAERPRDASCH